MATTKTCALLLALTLAATACGGDDESRPIPTAVPTTPSTTRSAATTVVAAATTPGAAAGLSTYTSQAFTLPFDVTVPSWLAGEADVDEPGFVTWDAPDIDRAVRFLLPTELYEPGATTATAPPDDYLAYLMAQAADGAEFTDLTDTTVDGRPATLLTASAATSLDGSLGCPETGMAPADCFGLQPDLKLRIAVIDAGDETLLVWVRDLRGASAEYESFESMLASIRFDEERRPKRYAETPRNRNWRNVHDDSVPSHHLVHRSGRLDQQGRPSGQLPPPTRRRPPLPRDLPQHRRSVRMRGEA